MAPVLAATARVLAIRAVVVLPFAVAALFLLWPDQITPCLGGPPCWVPPDVQFRNALVQPILLVEVVLIASLALDALIRRVRQP